jgi:hypothetical protein
VGNLCWWLYRVQVKSELPTTTQYGHRHRVTVTRGCIDTICLSWWWARCARNMYSVENKYRVKKCASCWSFTKRNICCSDKWKMMLALKSLVNTVYRAVVNTTIKEIFENFTSGHTKGKIWLLSVVTHVSWQRNCSVCFMWCTGWIPRLLAWPPNTVTEDWSLAAVNTDLLRLNLWSCVHSAEVYNAKSDRQVVWMWCGAMCRQMGPGVPHNSMGLERTTSLGKMEASNRNLSKGNLKFTNF